MKNIIQTILLILVPGLLLAQEADSSGDFFSSVGKIYVVVGVLAILFLGIVAFMVALERRVAALEAEEDYQ